MNKERIEEVLLALVAAAMLSFVLPFSPARSIAVSVLVACMLIGILVLRSIAWHHDGITPFDGIMVIGIGITIAYLASFAAFVQTAFNTLLMLLFACFYALLAVMLYQHRTMPVHARTRHLRVWKVKPKSAVSRAEFRKGIEPIAEHAPSWEKQRKQASAPKTRWYHRALNVQPLQEHAPTWERRTVVSMHPPVSTRAHGPAFHAGMEPIHEITPEHLHRMGVYDTEPRRRK